jgi:phage/plasmid-like protein (TIGR03299 family)
VTRGYSPKGPSTDSRSRSAWPLCLRILLDPQAPTHAVAWVEVSVSDTITTPEGVAFRPNLLATTSFEGSIATTYKRSITDLVRDNTRDAALAEDGQQFKVKHSRNSALQLAPAMPAIQMIYTVADDFAREVARLCAVPVSPGQWKRFLALQTPTHGLSGQTLTGRALTIAERKRDRLMALYASDPRVSPWAGTAQWRPASGQHL